MGNLLTSDLFIEILGAVTGLIYLYFSIRQNIWLWPWGILTSLLYVYVFYRSKFYADMSLQFYYLGISIYGWYFWKRGGKRKDEKGELSASFAGMKKNYLFIFSTIVLTIVAGYFLDNYTDSPLPFWDAFTGTGSIVATWMLARKYIENWIFWIIIDAVSLGTYVYKGLYPTVILFAVYTGMAAIGYFQWKREMILKTQS
jgi:nicotinamide mononucleotide transporter